MKLPVILIAGLFNYFLFDLNLFRNHRLHSSTRESNSFEFTDQKEKIKKIQRKYKKRKYNKKTIYLNKQVSYRDSNPRDGRFSNQRSLRRMYRNG